MWLALPTKEEFFASVAAGVRKGTKWKPTEKVKDPIIKALDDVEAIKKQKGDDSFIIKRHFSESTKVDEWLEESFITVELSDANEIGNLLLIEKKRRSYIEKAKRASEKTQKQ